MTQVNEEQAVGFGLDESMMAPVAGRDITTPTNYRILPWLCKGGGGMASQMRERTFYIYKDADANITAGTRVEKIDGGFRAVENNFVPIDIATVDSLAACKINLASEDFRWFEQLKSGLRTVDTAVERPWVIVVMGCPGVGKSVFIKSEPGERHTALSEKIGAKIPFGNIAFKQLDDIINYGAADDLNKLWDTVDNIADPHERFRTYWANKQHIFTRYAVDKPSKSEDNLDPQSYEFRVGAKMIESLTNPAAPYNIAMETTGLSPGLVKFGLTAPHYAQYNKLVVLVDFHDADIGKTTTHSRLLKEMNVRELLGGEQFGAYLDVIARKARETFKVCKKFGEVQNQKLDEADSKGGRWYAGIVQNTFTPDPVKQRRIDAFYEGRNWDRVHKVSSYTVV
jgi:hypothetical protein